MGIHTRVGIQIVRGNKWERKRGGGPWEGITSKKSSKVYKKTNKKEIRLVIFRILR